ncbi:MAG TPA: hypothetical protein VK881_04690 [bacterium]|nr:hypothetical protein [bacterium]
MHVTNWGMFLLGVYLVLAGLTSLGVFGYSGVTIQVGSTNQSFVQLTSLIGLVAGVLILMEHSRGR